MPPQIRSCPYVLTYKVLMVDFQKKDLDKKKVFVVCDEALGFILPSLLVNPALGYII